jgi:hypothetical protein
MSSAYMQIIFARVVKIAAPYPMALTPIALVNIELNPWIGRVQERVRHCRLLAKPGPVVEAPTYEGRKRTRTRRRGPYRSIFGWSSRREARNRARVDVVAAREVAERFAPVPAEKRLFPLVCGARMSVAYLRIDLLHEPRQPGCEAAPLHLDHPQSFAPRIAPLPEPELGVRAAAVSRRPSKRCRGPAMRYGLP